MNLDKYSWSKPGLIWYRTMGDQRYIKSDATFQEFATHTVRNAWRYYGETRRQIVKQAWNDVGIIIVVY